jgi:acyl transferase domain-containing protein
VLSSEIATSLRNAKLDARTISYVESASTGFKMGDEIEMALLTGVFKQCTTATQFCRLGTVKSNMGHAEAASGIAQLIKVILQLDHGQLTPLLHLDQIDPNLDLADTPFVLQRQLEPWERPMVEIDGTRRQYPRRALVNSLGLGGTFSNVVVEEHREATRELVSDPHERHLIVLSAKNPERLAEMCQQLGDFVARHPQLDVRSLAHTLQVGRRAMPARLAFVVTTLADLMAGLSEARTVLSGDQAASQSIYIGGHTGSTQPAMQAAQLPAKGAKLQLEQLAVQWVNGAAVDWQARYTSPVKKMVLPGYPFARTRAVESTQFNY